MDCGHEEKKKKKKNTVHHIDFLYNSNVTNNKFNYGNVDGVVQCGWAVQQ